MIDVLNPRDVCVRYILEDAATERPDAVCVTFDDGTSWTRQQALEQACAAAHELRRAGVTQGSAVGAALPNGADYLRTWWGAAMLGAAVVPVNTAYRGPLLRRLMDLAAPAAVVSAPDFRTHLLDSADATGTVVLDPPDLLGTDVRPPVLEREIAPWDACSLALTSGSTGPSKLVRVTSAQSMAAGRTPFAQNNLDDSDVYLADTPLIHVATFYYVIGSLRFGARIAMQTRPKLDAYWEIARDTGSTTSSLYSTMITYLEAQPRRAAEREHKLRLIVSVPLPADPKAFSERFGVAQLSVGFGATETGAYIATSADRPIIPGSTGRVLPHYEVRLVDENDVEVPDGEVGEAVLRADKPWLITTEYIKDPEATARVWRNGWFHTGDLMYRDGEGNYYFIDRKSDAIRRRGQNISSFDVETVVREYPGVSDVAAVAQRSEGADGDEVKVWISVDAGATIDFADLLRFSAEHLAHYMVPRYFEIIDEFPRTPSAKIKKQELRERGFSDRTWDRIAHGLDVTRFGVIELGAS